jgi:hypothetical protein
MAEVIICTLFWAGVVWMFGTEVYKMSWAERRGLALALVLFGFFIWAEATYQFIPSF